MEIFKRTESGLPAIQRLAAIEIETWLKVRTKRDDLAVIEREAIEVVADALESGAAVPGESAALRKLRDDLSNLSAALATLRTRRLAAIDGTRTAKAAAIREQAAAKQAQAEEIERKSAPLIAKLAALEDIDVLKILSGTVSEFSGFTLPVSVQPLSVRLRFEAENLRALAVRMEAQSLNADGAADGYDLESLVRAVYADPSVVGPPIAQIENWYASSMELVEAYEKSQFSNTHLIKPAGFELRIQWVNGSISERNSFVQTLGARINASGATALPHVPAPQTITPVPPLPPMQQICTRTFA